jgi:hypothetical protein
MRSLSRTVSALMLAVVALLVPAAAASAKQAPKAWAKQHHLKGAWRTKDADKDGLANLAEYKLKTNPKKADTDGDKLSDGDEIKAGDNPLARDSDRDGVKDGAEHAGVITAFDGTSVTIRQFVGGTVTASLTDDADCYGADDDTSAGDSSATDGSTDTTTDDGTVDDGAADVTWDDGTGDPTDDSDTADTSTYDDGTVTDVSAGSGCDDARFKKGAIVQAAELEQDGGQLWLAGLVLAPAK